MKIALLTNGIYPFAMGGMQKHSYYLARYLAHRKVYVDVFHYIKENSQKQDISDFFKPEELTYITFHQFTFPTSVYFPGHYIFNSYRYSCEIYDELKAYISEFDFIYLQGFTGLKLLQEKKSISNMPPIGVNFHGLEMFQIAANLRSKLEHYLYRPPVKFTLKRADVAFSLGGKLTDILKKQVDKSTKIWITPIGLEKKWLTKTISTTNKLRKFIFIGRFERRKGIEELNEAIKKIENTFNFTFDFIGPIPEKNRLKKSNYHYHGAIYDEDKIIEIVSQSDILVCPSYSEGMPTVILEGMARGLAVIATDVGAVNELVTSENGWLINPGSITDLEQALGEALTLSDEQLIKKKQMALGLIEKKFTWNKVVDITLNKIKKASNCPLI